MTRAKIAVVLGVLLLGLGFTLGTGPFPSIFKVTVEGNSYACGVGFPETWLDTGLPQTNALDTRTAAERALAAKVARACEPQDTRSRWLLWGTLGLGGLLLLSGWTVARELRERDEREEAPEPVLSGR